MDLLALFPFFLLGLGLLWALWLIFKRDLLSQNLGKLISYFIGVFITFAAIGWLVDTYLPGWVANRLQKTANSREVQTIQTLGRQIWEQAAGGQPVPTQVPTQAPGTEVPTVVPPTEVPTAVPTVAPTTEGGGEINPSNIQTRYVVQKGDTLYSLGRRFGVSVEMIKSANNLTSDDIKVGQELIIPKP